MISLISFQFYQIELFILMIQSFQIIITMFVSRRFLKLYLTLEQKVLNTRIYQYYFCILVSCNIIFICACFISFFIFTQSHNHLIDEYVSYAHTCFSLIISIILYIFSLKIHELIEANIRENQNLKGQTSLTFKDDGGFTSSIILSFTSKKNRVVLLYQSKVNILKDGCFMKEAKVMERKNRKFFLK